ncbi:MAG: prolyl oligopeptidase family serine peptidase [Propionibacteriaceae bacterium]|jgi:dienelactone hydrolase|nr:prolyl oligopeptidase family serine peptidase [Propionibacteriaceae bacterium]
MITAGYGAWTSPIDAASLVGNSNGLHWQHGLLDGDVAYWSQALAAEGGRTTIFRREPNQAATEITPGRYVRNSVNEYGGGEWTVAGGVVVYSDWPSGDLRAIAGEDSLLLSGQDNAIRYGCLSYYPAQRLVLGVREDHTGSGEPVQSIFALDIARLEVTTVAAGADFYAYPTLGDDGLVAWMEWDHPNMPWDSTRIMAAEFGERPAARLVSTGGAESAVYPAWRGQTLVYLSDADGYWGFRAWSPDSEAPPLPLLPPDSPAAAHDFCGPIWSIDAVPYSLFGDSIGCSWFDGGCSKLGVLHGGELRQLPSAAVAATIFGHGERCVAMLGYADRPPELVILDWLTGETTLLAADGEAIDPGYVSTAVPLDWEGDNGQVHAWYYPPKNPKFAAPPGDLPPAIVLSHGGPTANSGPEYRESYQFWTTRGFAIVDVNYSGSTGYGRAYRERLRGAWGIADVRDCADAAKALVARGLADPRRIAIKGASAGGYTTLQALVTSDVFAAGVSSYGVGDLEALANDTHKFESRYLDGLVAPYPAERQTWIDRSPVHNLGRLSCPMLILQGSEDAIVPPQQAYDMAAAVRANGLEAELVVFEGEGHGFRKAENIIAATQATQEFLQRLFVT